MYAEKRLGTGPKKQLISQSLLLHLRLLLDCFYKPPFKEDVWVGHFRELPAFEASFPQELYTPPDRLPEVKDYLDKRLAHFSSARWTGDHPDLEYYAKYFDGLERRIASFQAALPDELRELFIARTQQFEHRDRTGGSASSP
jgi:hypothetical protein